MHMQINIKHRLNNFDLPRKLEHIDSKVDVIPFITMKYLSQKQEESGDDTDEFQDRYGIIFRDYELLTNIIENYKGNEDASLSNVKSALNVLKNSKNPDIKEIFSQINETKITKEVFEDIIEILESEDDLTELFQHVNYVQYRINNEKTRRIIPPTVKLLSKLAATNHEVKNVYDPSALDAQTITELEDFDHATVYVKDSEKYYHSKQNILLNDITPDKISITQKEVLIDDQNDDKYDTIVSVPYLKQRRLKDENNEKYSEFECKSPNAIHLLNLIDHLDDDGIIVTTTTQDLLVKKDALKIREYLIEENLLDTVIDYETGHRSRDITILIINKNKKTDDFLFVKPPAMFIPFLVSAFHDDILEVYNERKIEAKFSNIISNDEIIKNEYNLNPKRYVYTLDYKQTPIKDILENQNEYSNQIKQLDEEIEELLKARINR